MAVVYVATIDTRYEVMAVAETADQARQLAAQKALAFLRSVNAVMPETNTVEKIIDYFCPTVTEIKIGTAAFTGDELTKEQ